MHDLIENIKQNIFNNNITSRIQLKLMKNLQNVRTALCYQIKLTCLQAGITAAPARAVSAVKNMNLSQQIKDIKLPDLPQAIKDLKF